MDKRVKNTILAVVLIIVGIAVFAIFAGNVFGSGLPGWLEFFGIPFVIWGLMLLISTYRKQK